jgi:DNA-binding CsgD family transcriptional regulator
MQARVKHRVEDLLHNICEGLLRKTPAEQILSPHSYECSLEKIKRRLACLKPEERKAVMMSRLGYRHEEIAVQMNISVESLRAHLRKGYLTLKTSASEARQE